MATAISAGLSACIITFNEADRIERCLEGVSFCDEIVVVDSHSSDQTRQLATRLGARVIERDWPGYRSQKQYATDVAHHDWVLCVDAQGGLRAAASVVEVKLQSLVTKWSRLFRRRAD